MKVLVLFCFIVFISGCLCCDNPFDTPVTVEQETIIRPDPPPSKATLGYAASTTFAAATTHATQVSSSTLRITTTTYPPQFDRNDLSVRIVGCDDDFYKNAMVAGYAINLGSVAASVVLVTEIQDNDGDPVEGGVKQQQITIPPNSQVQFSQTYTKPPSWKKCRAYIQ